MRTTLIFLALTASAKSEIHQFSVGLEATSTIDHRSTMEFRMVYTWEPGGDWWVTGTLDGYDSHLGDNCVVCDTIHLEDILMHRPHVELQTGFMAWQASGWGEDIWFSLDSDAGSYVTDHWHEWTLSYVDRDYRVITEAPEPIVGDANRDGRFGSEDLVQVFATGQYEDGFALNSVWETGDWNGDREFDSADLVLAMSTGSYQEVGAAVSVPEPASVVLALIGVVLGCKVRFPRREIRATNA